MAYNEKLYNSYKQSYDDAVRTNADAGIIAGFKASMEKYAPTPTSSVTTTATTVPKVTAPVTSVPTATTPKVTTTPTAPVTTTPTYSNTTVNTTPTSSQTTQSQWDSIDIYSGKPVANKMLASAQTTNPTTATNTTNSTSNTSWNLTPGQVTDGKWDLQPTLTIRGQQYKYDTPQEYLNALTSLKNQGATGDFDRLIREYQNMVASWQTVQQQPQTQQQTQPVNNQVGLRDFAESLNMQVGWDAATGNVTLGNQAFSPQQLQQAGLQNVGGRWTGTSDQIANLFGLTQLRSGLEALGKQVGFDSATGTITVDGIAIDPRMYSMTNIGGYNYVSPATLQEIINATGGNTTLGLNQQPGQVYGQQQGDNAANNFYMEQNQQLLKEMADVKKQLLDYTTKNTNDQQINNLINEIKNFKGQFDSDIKSIIQSTLAPFNYNAEEDKLLQQAIQYADKSMMEEMNRRGILNSSLTADKMALIRTDLIPKYQQMAYQQYNDQIDRQLRTAEFMNRINQQDYDRFTAYANAAINQLEKVDAKTVKSFEKVIDTISEQIKNNETARKNVADEKAKLMTYALDKLTKLGYADNEVAQILGVPVGTPSQEAKKLALDRYDKYNIEAVKSSNTIKENEMKAKLEKEKLQEQAIPKINLGEYMRYMGNLSADKAQEYLNNNAAEIISKVGVEYPKLQEYIDSKRKTEFENTLKINSEARQNASAERSARADERAAASVERAERNEKAKIEKERREENDKQFKDFYDEMKDYVKTSREDAGDYWKNTNSFERKQAYDYIILESKRRGLPPEVGIATAKSAGLSEFIK